MITKKSRSIAAISAVALLTLLAACSKSPSGSSSSSKPSGSNSSSAAPSPSSVALTGTIAFNQTNLTKLDAALKAAMKGKSLSAVNIAMVVNVAADYWKAGQVGFQKGCAALGLASSKCTFFGSKFLIR